MSDSEDQGLTLEQFNALPDESEGMTLEQFNAMPDKNSTGAKVAAGLRGVRESIPFGQDIGAAGNYLFGNPLTGEKAPSTFEDAKRQQMQQDEAYFRDNPASYATGFGSGLATQMLVGGPGAAAAIERGVAKKVAPAVGKTAGDLIGAGAAGSATGALYGAGQGASLEDRLNNAISGAEIGAPLGVAGGAISKGAQKLFGKTKAIPGVGATKDTLEKEARDAYTATEAAGLKISQRPVQKFYTDLMDELTNKHYYRPGRHPELKHAVSELHGLTTGRMGATGYKHITLSDFEKVNQFANDALMSKDPNMRRIGGIFKDRISDFLDTLGPADILSGDKNLALNSLKTARDFWKRSRKMQKIDTLYDDAKLDAAVRNGSKSEEDYVRTKLGSLIKRLRTNPQGWTRDEIAAMEAAAKPHKWLDRAGWFDPTKGPLRGIVGTGAIIHSPWIAAPAAGAAHFANVASKRHVTDNLERLKDIIAAGGLSGRTPKRVRVPAPSQSDKIRKATVPGSAIGVAQKGLPMAASDRDDREGRARGGKLGSKDHPARHLSRMERAAKRAREALAHESTPLMDAPDEQIANALRIAEEK